MTRKPTRGETPATPGDVGRKPTRGESPIAETSPRKPEPPARRATRDAPLPPPIARRPTAEVEIAADIDLFATNVQRLEDLQPEIDAGPTRVQKLSELQPPPDADRTSVQSLASLQPPSDADRTSVQSLAALQPPLPDQTGQQSLAELEALVDESIASEQADFTSPGVRLAPPISADPWADAQHPVPPDDATQPRALLPSPPDDPTNPRAFLTAAPGDATHPRAFVPEGRDAATDPRAINPVVPEDATNPRAALPNSSDEIPDEMTNPLGGPAAFVGDVTTPAASLRELGRVPRAGAEAPAQDNPAPLFLAAFGICVAVVAGGWFLVGEPRPGRMDLEAVYPYGVHGYLSPDGRAAPSALDVAFTLQGEEPCMSGGTELCLVYRYAYQGFSGTMRVRREGDVWVRVGDRGLPIPIVKPGQERLEAVELTPRSREVRDEEFAHQPQGRELRQKRW